MDVDGGGEGDEVVGVVEGVLESYACCVDVRLRSSSWMLKLTYGCLLLCLWVLRGSFCWLDGPLIIVRGLRLRWSR